MPAKERFRKYVIGDVAREIVNSAGIPVLVVRTAHKIKIGQVLRELLTRIFRSPEKVGAKQPIQVPELMRLRHN